MIKLDNICALIFIVAFISLPFASFIKFTDELCTLLMVGIAMLDCVINGSWIRYKLMWIILGVMTCYAVYSLTLVHFNTPRYIAMDWLIQLKPYIPFVVMLAVAPTFPGFSRLFLRCSAIAIGIYAGGSLLLSLVFGYYYVELLFFHVFYCGLCCILSVLVLLYSSIDENGDIPGSIKIIALLILSAGLLCTRSKYYGEFVIIVFMIYFYRPGIMRYLTFSRALIIAGICLLTIAVGWNKIEYYFITGNSSTFDPNVIESFARPVLFVHGAMIIADFIPFGSGLASFATFASVENYSSLYYKYGLDKVWGMSPEMPDFICDAFYPSLAQFGLVGLGLFIWFWVYAYHFLKTLIRKSISNKYEFAIGVSVIAIILIESIAATTFVQHHGMLAMMLLGIICGKGREIELKMSKQIAP